jgi:phospholipid/cholesterol/gamma-HCH transport system substrate-binding protein
MKEGFARKEQLVGGFLLVLIIFTMATLLMIAQKKGWLTPKNTYRVKFKQGYNLHQGSLVKMFNTEIGRISKMQIIRGIAEPQVEITIKVEKEYAKFIRLDSFAEVVSPTFIGSEYIAINAGSSGYALIEPYGYIPSKVRKTLTENLEEIINEANIAKFKAAVREMSERLKADEAAVASAVNHFDQVMTELIAAKGTLGQLLTKDETYKQLTKNLSDLDKVLADLQIVAKDLRPTAVDLKSFALGINGEIKTLQSILADLKGGTRDFPAMMETASETIRGGKKAVDAINANPIISLTAPKEPQSQSIHVEPRTLP